MQIYENFISYRRSESIDTARLLYEKLVSRGKTTFLDIVTLGSGEWSPKILSAIDSCTNFIFIRNEHSFDRCDNKDDVVRREIKEAIAKKKNIILVSSCNTDIPKNLPGDIADLGKYNEIHYDPAYLDAFMDKLIGEFVYTADLLSRSDDKRDFIIFNGVLVKYVGHATIVSIPDDVKNIAERAFMDQTKISEIHFSESVESIGESAFERCNRITNIVAPPNLKIIGKRAFARCYGLSNISLNSSLKTIEEEAFAFCEGLKSIMLNEELVDFSPAAVNNCGQLQWIGSSIDNPYYYSEEGILFDKKQTRVIRCPENYQLEFIKIPPSVKIIGKLAFARCKKVQDIDFPRDLERIEDQAFFEASNITQLVLPDKLQIFKSSAVDGWEENQSVVMGRRFNPALKYKIEGRLSEIRIKKANHLGNQFCLIKTVFETEAEAKKMARDLIDKHLIVSGQISRGIKSLYVWKDEFQSENEIELTCFTEIGLWSDVEQYIKTHHSYEVCELICIPITNISEEFGKWISDYVGKIV